MTYTGVMQDLTYIYGILWPQIFLILWADTNGKTALVSNAKQNAQFIK